MTLAEVLGEMARQFSETFNGNQVAEVINSPNQSTLKTLLREFLFEGEKPPEVVSPKSVGRRLARHVNNVVMWEGRSVVLRAALITTGEKKGVKEYEVKFLDGKPAPVEPM